jgi:hypothetical protein
MAQAAFATEHCFTNVCSSETDAILQPQFGKVRLGIKGFSVRHIHYNEVLFDILMGRGQLAPANSMAARLVGAATKH